MESVPLAVATCKNQQLKAEGVRIFGNPNSTAIQQRDIVLKCLLVNTDGDKAKEETERKLQGEVWVNWFRKRW